MLSYKQKTHEVILAFWQRTTLLTYLLAPFSWIFQIISFLRRKHLEAKRAPFHIPIIIVGNITVGGTGKTPLVGCLQALLKKHGFHPGIVTHGYGTKKRCVVSVHPTSFVEEVGDEALLLAKKCHCPMIAGKDRNQAVLTMLQRFPEVDVILCDDGLQHYALARSLEIAVIDGENRFGNGFCLPAGPLRERPRRLKSVDFIISNGEAKENEWEMKITFSKKAYQVSDPSQTRLLEDFAGKTVHAVTGIGRSDRFFAMLRAKGIQVIAHSFIDHYLFKAQDLQFEDDLFIIMTEKDAVKCQSIAPHHAFAIPIEVHLPDGFTQKLLRSIKYGQKTA